MSSSRAKLKAKIVAIGDGMAGKTCMIIAYVHHYFPTECAPTVFDMYPKSIQVDGLNYDAFLWDTAGQENYDALRLLAYPDTQCFLLCFSLVNRTSFENITQRWIPEIKHYCPQVPIVLVGTKSDLRRLRNPNHVSEWEGRELKATIRADSYVECSAKNGKNLDRVFRAAIGAHIRLSQWAIFMENI